MKGYGEGEHTSDARERKRERRKAFRGRPNTLNPPTSRADTVGQAYSASNWALGTNERSVAKQIPLLSEFPSYSEWGGEARRWARALYIQPVSSVIDYFMVNLLASPNRVDSESGGRLKYKLRAK